MTSKKTLSRQGDRNDILVAHLTITVNACGNAQGIKLPPYKGKHLYNTWTEGGPDGTCYGVSQPGWMDEGDQLPQMV